MNYKKIIATITLSTVLMGGVKPLVTYAVDSNVQPAVEETAVNKNDMTETYIENFKNRIGLSELIKFIQIDQNHYDFVKWIYDTPEAMKLYLTGGYASAVKQGSMASYQYRNPYNKANELKALEIWYKIWNKHEKSREGINLKIAIATSLEFANGVNTWLRGQAIDPVTRYENFANDKAQSILMKDFFKLTVQEMRNVVNAKISDEEMKWLRDYISKNKKNMINRNKITQGHTLLKYQTVNPETKESVQGPNFYGPNPTIEKVIKYGGVCGAMSKFSSILAQSYGVPAFPVGQPGHCAYEFLGANHNYSLGYDIYGWEKSGNYYTTLPYIRLHNTLSKDPSRYARYEASEDSRFKALIAKDDETKIKYLDEATVKEPLNYLAWEEKIKVVAKSSSDEEVEKVFDQAKEALKHHPIVKENVTQDNAKNKVYGLFKDNTYKALKENVTMASINSLKNSINRLPEGKYRDKFNNLLKIASESIQEFTLLGFYNRQFATLTYYTDGTNYTNLTIAAGQPHSGFNGNYATIKVTNAKGEVTYTKEFNGNTNYKSEAQKITLGEGYTLEFILKEANRFQTSNNNELKKNPVNKTYRYEVKDNKFVFKSVK